MPEEIAPVTETTTEGTSEGTSVVETAEPEVAAPWYEGVDETSARTAMDFHKHIQTEEGAMESFFQLGRAFGLGVKEIEALFTGEAVPAAPAAPAAPVPDDDDLMTYAQFKAAMEAQVGPITQTLAQQQQQAVEFAARGAVDSTIKELGIADEATKAAILQLGDRYLGDDLSPHNVAAAVRKGHADFTALVESELKRRTTSKVETAARVPSAPAGGGAPATQPDAEPQSVKEAIARARQRLAAAR